MTISPDIQCQTLRGATLILIEDRSLPLVRITVTTRSGCGADPQGQEGLSSLMWEMLLRGTQKRDRTAYNQALERLGSQLDAYCASEFAGVQAYCLTRHFAATMELLTEALCCPAFDEAEFKKLIDESVERLRHERDDDDTVAGYFLREALYPHHPLGRWGRGYLSTLPGLSREHAQALYNARVQPSQLVFAAAGDLDWKTFQAHVETVLAQLRPQSAAPVAYAPPRRPQGLHIHLIDKPERTQCQLRVATLGVPGNHADLLPIYLATTAFGGTFTAPFTHEVRDVRGWSYVASVETSRRRRWDIPWVAHSAPASKDAVDCLALELDLLDRFALGEQDPHHIDLARQYLLNRFPFEVASANDMLMPAVLLTLLDEAPHHIYDFPRDVEALAPSVCAEAIQRHFAPKNWVVVAVATAAKMEAAMRLRFPDATITVTDYRSGIC